MVQAPRPQPYPQPRPQVPAQPRPPAQATARPAIDVTAIPPAPAMPIARGVPREEAPTATASLRIPSPEELGVGGNGPAPAPAEKLDWESASARMTRLRVVGYRLEKSESGASMFSCKLADGRVVRGDGGCDAEAVRVALDRVSQMVASR